MSAEFTCDGCGKKSSGVFYPRGTSGWHKPGLWFQRQDDSEIQDACCRDCIQVIADKSGKTSVVLPF